MFSQRRLMHARGYLGLGLLADAERELALAEAGGAETAAVEGIRLLLLHKKHDWPTLRDFSRSIIARASGITTRDSGTALPSCRKPTATWTSRAAST